MMNDPIPYIGKKSGFIERAIAVLPFVNMSGNSDFEYFSDGITEEIINALARIDSLKVTSRTSSFYFKNVNRPIKQIAEELSVSVVMEGSVRLSQDTVRITAQLIHPEDDYHFWSETWDRKLENIFEIQDEISLHIAEKLREHYGHFEIQDHLVEKKTNSFDAYDFALKAKYHFNKWNPVGVRKAIGLYEKAIKTDSGHVDSYVGLADAYSFLAVTGMMPQDEAWDKVRGYINRAHALDPDHAGINYQLANLSFFLDADFLDALKHGLKSVELKPSYPEAHQFLLFLYSISGNFNKAAEHLNIILEIDPLSQETLFYKAYFYYRTGNFAEALKLLTSCLKENPANIPAYTVKCYCLIKAGKYDEALAFLGAMPDEITIPDEKLGIRCVTNILKKDFTSANQDLALLTEEAKNETSFQAHSYLYVAYACMGQSDKAFSWLDKVLELKSPIIMLSVQDPLINDLAADPRFDAYKQKIFKSRFSQEKAQKKKPTVFEEKEAIEYTSRIIQFINEEKPYLIPDLSLRSLAGQVQLHPNKLSWLLNEQLGKNFNEFINHYRVEYFKKLAQNPDNSHISLLGLAYESGFSSKTVFNTCFKKEVGMTPKEFLKKKE